MRRGTSNDSSVVNQNIEFPNEININLTEKRAPTDESVRLLNEMQDRAINNILCKISNDTNNEFKWEAYFLDIVNLDDMFSPAGILVVKAKINGRQYQRKIKVKSGVMSKIPRGEYGYTDLENDIRRFLFVQLCFLLGEVLLEDQKSLEEVLNHMLFRGCTNVDYNSLAEIEE